MFDKVMGPVEQEKQRGNGRNAIPKHVPPAAGREDAEER